METFTSLPLAYLDTSPLHEEHRRVDPHGLMDGRLNTEHLLVNKLVGECSHQKAMKVAKLTENKNVHVFIPKCVTSRYASFSAVS